MYTILGVIAKPLGMLLNLLYGFVQNYGLTIIIFTLIVKLCLSSVHKADEINCKNGRGTA